MFIAVILGQKNKDHFENLNQKKAKVMKQIYHHEGLEVPKGKPGRKTKATYPSALIPAIPEGVADDTFAQQKQSIQVEWKKSKND